MKSVELTADPKVVRRLMAEGADLTQENLEAVSRQIEDEERFVVYRVVRDGAGEIKYIIARRVKELPYGIEED